MDCNTLVFHLKIVCVCRPNLPPVTTDPCKLFDYVEVTSSDLVWVPQGEQGELEEFRCNPPVLTNPNIVLVKLQPEQEINAELYVVNGLGKDHAKWSPVGAFPPAWLMCAF